MPERSLNYFSKKREFLTSENFILFENIQSFDDYIFVTITIALLIRFRNTAKSKTFI